MNIRIQHTELGRYAHIETVSNTLDVLLDDYLPTAASLRRLANAMRQDATTVARALLLDMAADQYDGARKI